MHFLTKTLHTPAKRTKVESYLSLYLAGFFVIAALGQLVAFEDYPSIIQHYDLLPNWNGELIAAAVIVSLEVFAIPYLLNVRTSLLMRRFSMICGFAALGWWLFVSIFLSGSDMEIINLGLFGAKLLTPSGLWSVFYILMLIGFAAYVSGGRLAGRLLPRRNTKQATGSGAHKIYHAKASRKDLSLKLPHLPAEVRRWITENAWWLTVLAVGIETVVLVALLAVIPSTTMLDPNLPDMLASINVGKVWFVIMVLVPVIILKSASISGLKQRLTSGWSLLFSGAVLMALSSLIEVLLFVDYLAIIPCLVLLVGVFLVAEIKPLFK